MNFPQYSPGPDEHEDAAQDFGYTVVIVANISAVAVLLLVTISCLCCVKRRPLQGRSVYNSYDRHLDHVPLEDLLSKPPLADPESVFSEASYDGRLSVHTTSRMTLLSDGSGGSYDYFSPPQQGSDHHNETLHHTASLKPHHPGDAPAHFSPARKWSSEKLKVNRAARPTRGQEKEAQRHSVQPDLIPLPTIRDDLSETSSLQSPETLSTKSSASNLTPETAKKQKSGKLPFESPTLERTDLKIHRESIKPECNTFSRSTRCSFSHEVGHVVHGNKIPRTSLTRTVEKEGVQCQTDSSALGTANITCHITTNPVPSVCANNITFNSGLCLDKTSADAAHLLKSQSDHVIFYDKLEHECEARTVVDNSGPNQISSATKSNTITALPSRMVLPASISNDGSLPTHSKTALEGASLETSSSRGGVNEDVALRRSFSFVGDNELLNGGRGISKTFSLNVNINFHFGNENEDLDVSRARCATVEKCRRLPVNGDHTSQSLVPNVSSNPDIYGQTWADDKNKTCVEINCHDRTVTDNSQMINSQPAVGRERLSEPLGLEGRISTRLSNSQSAGRRFSFAESPMGKLAPVSAHESCPKKLSEKAKGQRVGSDELGVSDEQDTNEKMNTIAGADKTRSSEQKAKRASSDDIIDLNTKSTTTESDSVSSDAESTGSKKSASKLQRTNAIIIDNKLPQLRRPLVTKKKTSLVSCEANLRNGPNTPAPASPVGMDENTDPIRSTTNEAMNRSGLSSETVETEIRPQASDGVDAKAKEGCTLQINNVTSDQSVDERLSANSHFSDSTAVKAKLSKTNDIEFSHRQQESSSTNRRKAMFFTPIDIREKTNEVGDSQTLAKNADQDKKSYKPVARPRRKNPSQSKDAGRVVKTELHKSMSDSAGSYQPSDVGATAVSKTLPSRGNSLIPVIIVDDETDDTASSGGDNSELLSVAGADLSETKNLDASDDSDYDNPWDNLDDAVKRASIRYNRRPSRLAAGTQNLLLKSAEDLGRLLEEAEKKRRLRVAGSHAEVLSPEDGDAEPPIIPFTRFSPYRHTVKGIVSETNMAASHSTEDILKNAKQDYTRLSLLRKDAAKEHFKKGTELRRPQSMTSKLKTKISSPERKHGKN